MYSKCTRYITDNIGKIVSGSEFNEYCDSQNSDSFKTILRNNMMNYSRNYQYKVGLNTSNDKLDKNGLTFSPTDKIWKYVDFGDNSFSRVGLNEIFWAMIQNKRIRILKLNLTPILIQFSYVISALKALCYMTLRVDG